MKVAITSKGTDLDSEVDPRFGRAAYFVIVDTETMAFQVVDNHENAGALQGAGIHAAATLSKNGAEVLLTGYCGPNAFKTLEAAKIKVANDATGTVKQAIDAFKAGEMSFAESANREANW